jgi:hypothetical protein
MRIVGLLEEIPAGNPEIGSSPEIPTRDSRPLREEFRQNFAGNSERIDFLRLVLSKDHEGAELWFQDDLALDEAIAHFLRISKERELGYDLEMDLNPGLGHIGPRRLPDA